jgi:Icc-related predicted phosphoesterase
MRCHYLSDLHVESQSFQTALPKGDVLIIAGDLCHARCLDPARIDRYSVEQRGRVMRVIDEAVRKFAHVLLIAGNHEHYDGVFDDTADLLRRNLPGVTVLDNQVIDIEGVRFFGGTLWTDLSDQTEAEITALRKGMGEYFFVKTRTCAPDQPLAKLSPKDTHGAHEIAWARLREVVTAEPHRQTVVITHHAPSRLGLNPRFAESALNPAYASSLDEDIATFENVPVWVHGHTHIARTYRIGNTVVRSNALGFAAKGGAAPGFSVKAHFEIG